MNKNTVEKLKRQYSNDLNASVYEVHKIAIDFKHTLELEYEKFHHFERLVNHLIDTCQFENVKDYLDSLVEIVESHKKNYQRFVREQKKFSDKMLKKYNEDAKKLGLYIAKYDELGNRIN